MRAPSGKRRKGEFALVYRGPVSAAIARRLEGAAYAQALLWHLQMEMRHGNEVLASGREIAAATGFTPTTVGKALRRLEEAYAIRRPRGYLIEVNPYLAWCGSDNEREEAQKGWSKEMKELGPDLKRIRSERGDNVIELEASA